MPSEPASDPPDKGEGIVGGGTLRLPPPPKIQDMMKMCNYNEKVKYINEEKIYSDNNYEKLKHENDKHVGKN